MKKFQFKVTLSKVVLSTGKLAYKIKLFEGFPSREEFTYDIKEYLKSEIKLDINKVYITLLSIRGDSIEFINHVNIRDTYVMEGTILSIEEIEKLKVKLKTACDLMNNIYSFVIDRQVTWSGTEEIIID
jgi:hypothetical protein